MPSTGECPLSQTVCKQMDEDMTGMDARQHTLEIQSEAELEDVLQYNMPHARNMSSYLAFAVTADVLTRTRGVNRPTKWDRPSTRSC